MRLFNKQGQKPSKGRQNNSAKHNASNPGLETLYGITRRLENRLSALEATMAIVRRDVARVDRKVYRDEEGSEPKQLRPAVSTVPLSPPLAIFQFDPMTGEPIIRGV